MCSQVKFLSHAIHVSFYAIYLVLVNLVAACMQAYSGTVLRLMLTQPYWHCVAVNVDTTILALCCGYCLHAHSGTVLRIMFTPP